MFSWNIVNSSVCKSFSCCFRLGKWANIFNDFRCGHFHTYCRILARLNRQLSTLPGGREWTRCIVSHLWTLGFSIVVLELFYEVRWFSVSIRQQFFLWLPRKVCRKPNNQLCGRFLAYARGVWVFGDLAQQCLFQEESVLFWLMDGLILRGLEILEIQV